MQYKSMMNRSSNISALFSILLLSCGGKLTTSAVSTSKQNDSSSSSSSSSSISSSSRKLQNNNVINNWSNKEQGLANLLFDKIEASKTSSPTVSPTTAQPTEVSFVSKLCDHNNSHLIPSLFYTINIITESNTKSLVIAFGFSKCFAH